MKTLFLLRHAKSSWKDETLQDFDRPLTARGRKAAKAIGEFIRKKDEIVDLVLSSPAVRARETIEIVMKAAGIDAELRYDQRIYEAATAGLLEVISQIEDEKRHVLLVGHNPGMEETLEILTGQAEHMATGNLAKIELKTAKWSKAAEQKGKLTLLINPKELAET